MLYVQGAGPSIAVEATHVLRFRKVCSVFDVCAARTSDIHPIEHDPSCPDRIRQARCG